MIDLNDADFLAEQAKKKVLYHIFCYFDVDLEKFNQPFITEQDSGFMYESVKASLNKGTFPPEKACGLVLVYLGTFDLNSGEFDIFAKPKVMLKCDDFIKKEIKKDA